MKKIVGIIAAFALVAGTVFAAPDVAPVIAEFTGDASLEWIANLDAETTGMKNATSSNLKIKFVSEGTKETSGDGLWGELKIKAGNVEVSSGGEAFAVPGVSIEAAKIHFIDGDTYLRMNIKDHGLDVGGGDIITATQSAKAFPKKGVTLADNAGFTLEFGIPVLDLTFAFNDNGQKKSKDKEYAFAAGATIKAVENLNLFGGFAYSTEKNAAKKAQDAAIAAKADYKFAIDDKLYLKPAVGFAMQGDAKNVAAALLFGWGAEGQEPNFAKFAGYDDLKASLKALGMTDAEIAAMGFDMAYGTISNKCADGFSVYADSTLEDKAGWNLLVSAYDSKLLAGFVPGLKAAVQFQANTETLDDFFVLDSAIAYSNTFDIWKVSANLGTKTIKLGDDTNSGFLYGAGVETDGIIDNTTLYVKYAGGQTAKDIELGNLKGSVTVGAKIHF